LIKNFSAQKLMWAHIRTKKFLLFFSQFSISSLIQFLFPYIRSYDRGKPIMFHSRTSTYTHSSLLHRQLQITSLDIVTLYAFAACLWVCHHIKLVKKSTSTYFNASQLTHSLLLSRSFLSNFVTSLWTSKKQQINNM
jgi:hypothetical protein